jgi:hypothetical protein
VIIKDTLIAFDVTVKECNEKIREYAIECANLAVRIGELYLELLDSTYPDTIVWNRAVEYAQREYDKQHQILQKWRYYKEILESGKEDSIRINENDIESAKAYDLLSLISSDILVKKRGSTYLALCPFHNEDTPSFTIKDNHFHCFGCGKHGDTIAWLMEYRGLNFIESVKQLK